MITTPLRTIVEQAVRRETDAFRALYDCMEPRIFAYVVYRTPRREVALDVTQDIFVALYQALPTFVYSSDAQFYGFLFTIVRRNIAKYYADKHTQGAKDAVAVPEALLPDVSPDTEAVLAVRQALATLDDIAREIVVLHHWSKYTFSDIAVMLGMSESAVRTRHHRTLTTLKQLLTFS
jgi:RNA polymerase sigma-70 factor, ECF subfamily